jgi:hypothetical protein
MSNVIPLFPDADKKDLNESLRQLNHQLLAIQAVTDQFATDRFTSKAKLDKQSRVLQSMSSRLMWLSYNLHQQTRLL